MAEKTRYRGMPTSVPAVPGARGAYPLPKPVAAILMNLSFRGHLFPSDSSGKSYADGKLPSFLHPVNDQLPTMPTSAVLKKPLTIERWFYYT
ncbi:MAG: hypothetical protein KJ814_03970 [Proteobacteria bacterium]|nr:hypothetical protein [Pseudomonadota bacterium]MBU2234344.1 hypothetical protein [Pseudomonadota bacterium]